MRLMDACKFLQTKLETVPPKGEMGLAIRTILHEIDRKLDLGTPPPQISVDSLDAISPVAETDEEGKTWPGGRIGALCDSYLHIASEFGQHNGQADDFVWAAREEQRLLAGEIRRLRCVAYECARALMNQPKGGVESCEMRRVALAGYGVENERGHPTLQPPADDAFVAIGSTRFSDGVTQTAESLAAARAARGLR